MSAPEQGPSPQKIALRVMDGEQISHRDIQREYGVGRKQALKLLERAKEISTGWMLMRLVRPRVTS